MSSNQNVQKINLGGANEFTCVDKQAREDIVQINSDLSTVENTIKGSNVGVMYTSVVHQNVTNPWVYLTPPSVAGVNYSLINAFNSSSGSHLVEVSSIAYENGVWTAKFTGTPNGNIQLTEIWACNSAT